MHIPRSDEGFEAIKGLQVTSGQRRGNNYMRLCGIFAEHINFVSI
jgi:hypothetical protein